MVGEHIAEVFRAEAAVTEQLTVVQPDKLLAVAGELRLRRASIDRETAGRLTRTEGDRLSLAAPRSSCCRVRT
ncbi:MAG: hypothetical protein HC838_17645, partial [Spirulinaceae cyanobacterium RM2_2_10]|nr:hypothetical protein [Spirulinaceae cyanobacterium RM2_2_10]